MSNNILCSVNGREYRAGCLPRKTKVGEIDPKTGKPFFEIYDPSKPLPGIARAGTAIDSSLIWHIVNQANQSSCCGCMGIDMVMLIREIMGLNRVILSQASLYGQGNGGRDEGMAIDTCLRLLKTVGACPVSLIDQYDWKGFGRGTWPDQWKEVAKLYRAVEVLDCPTVELVHAANEAGHPVGYGAKGHAVVHIGPGRDINSWGRDWGDDGIGPWVTSDAELQRGLDLYGGFIVFLATDPDNDGDLPSPI